MHPSRGLVTFVAETFTRMRSIFTFIFALMCLPTLHAQETSQTYDRVTRMLDAIDAVNTLTYTMRGTELMDGELTTKTSLP